ncbi:hypothetical protein Tco_0431041 [Tanacetum coccineum]
MDDPNITMEDYIKLEEEKALRRGTVYNWETATYGKIWYDEDVHDLRSVETEFPAIVFDDAFTSEVTPSCKPTSNNPSFPSPELTVSYFDDLDFFKDLEKEFPAIVYNDALTSKSDFLIEPIVNPQHIDEFNLNNETSLSECDEEEQNGLYFNNLFPFNVIYPDDLKSDTDNDNDEIDIEQPSGDMSVIPSPNVINIDTQGSNKLLETNHDTSNKFFKTEIFIKNLNVNIMTCNHLSNGMSFIFLIMNLYVPFGIPFNPKLFNKDEIYCGMSNLKTFCKQKVLAGDYPECNLSYCYRVCLPRLSIRRIQTPWIRRIDLLDVIQSLRRIHYTNTAYTGINTAYPGEPSERNDNVGGVFINLEISKCWSLEIPRRLFNTLFAHELNLENHS